MANRTAVGPDGLPAELFKVLADEEELNKFGKFYHITVAVWRGGGVPQQWKDVTNKVLHKEKDRTECGNIIVASSWWLMLAKYSSKSSLVA